ncbi:MAG TPA: PDZ domain-containing protein [Opitutaceae bacterium]
MRPALAFLLLWVAGTQGVRAQAVGPDVPRLTVGQPVVMEKFVVQATLASVVVRTNYEMRNNEEATLVRVVVEEVRADSRAARAGVEKGMHILAIEGIPIRGLTEKDFSDVMAREIDGSSLTLTVRRRNGFRSLKIEIPVRQAAPLKD